MNELEEPHMFLGCFQKKQLKFNMYLILFYLILKMSDYDEFLYPHQRDAITAKHNHNKCLINMWYGTGKTRTFTLSLFKDLQVLSVIVFPSLGLINQYNNDYFLMIMRYSMIILVNINV